VVGLEGRVNARESYTQVLCNRLQSTRAARGLVQRKDNNDGTTRYSLGEYYLITTAREWKKPQDLGPLGEYYSVFNLLSRYKNEELSYERY